MFLYYYKKLPKILRLLVLLSLIVDIVLTGLYLYGVRNNDYRVTIVSFLSKTLWNENLVTGLIIIILLIGVFSIFITFGTAKISMAACTFALDSMNQRFFAIDKMYNNNEITLKEADQMRERVNEDAQWYSSLDSTAKILSVSVKLIILLSLVNIAGGTLIGRIINGYSWLKAMEAVVSYSAGNILFFIVPLIIVNSVLLIISFYKQSIRFR